MEHPDVTHVMRTGYATKRHVDWECNHGQALEDMYGNSIEEGDSYFIDEERNIVHVENMKEYLSQFIGVLFYEGGE